MTTDSNLLDSFAGPADVAAGDPAADPRSTSTRRSEETSSAIATGTTRDGTTRDGTTPVGTTPGANAITPTPHDSALAPAEEPLFLIRPSSGWATLNLAEVWQFRDLLFSLASRDLKLRYKQTALGVIWVILQPLLAAGVFSFVFGMVAKLPSDNKPYFLFSYAGLLGWNVFSGTLSKSSACLIGNANLISKIYFPRLLLPLSSIPAVLVDFLVALGMMAVLLVIYHVPLTPGILLLPVWLTIILLIAMGVGLSTAALTVRYRDVQYILPVATQILMYASPIAYGLKYAMERVPAQYQFLYLLNPLSTPLEAFRASLLGSDWPPIPWLIYSAVCSIAVFLLGAYSFKRMERQFADVV